MAEDEFYKQPTMPGVRWKHPQAGVKQDVEIPKQIGPYKIEGLLDKGGMSLLFLGVNPETKDPLTVKVLAPEFLAEPEIVQRFLQEAEIIALADHPNIVKLYGHGRWEGGLYIAMEFIQGITLKHFMTHQAMSLRRALEVTLDVAYALCHLHTHGVIHRDLKPENILMTESGSIKVIDFGIAQLMTETEDERRTRRQRLMGTPIYMSPEQKEDPDSVSFPSDIYSLAIICFELVLGKLSHGVVQLSLMPKGLQPILSKALAPKPEDRYQDIVDFITDISNYLNSPSPTKEGRGKDRASDLLDTLHLAQTALLPSREPQWPKVDIGFITHKILRVSGLYFDFFDLPGGDYGVIMVEPATPGEEALVYSAVFRGTIRTLAHLTNDPAELIGIANELLRKDPINQSFKLSYLVLKPKQNLMQYLSCGFGCLWHQASGLDSIKKIEADNQPVGTTDGAEFRAVSHSWGIGDTLVLTSFGAIVSPSSLEPGFTEQDFQNLLKENASRAPQKLVETAYRRIVTSAKRALDHRVVALIAVQRQG